MGCTLGRRKVFQAENKWKGIAKNGVGTLTYLNAYELHTQINNHFIVPGHELYYFKSKIKNKRNKK